MYAGHFDFSHPLVWSVPSLLTPEECAELPELDERFVPETGTAVLFQHMVLRAGRRVIRGTKYVLRSDVVFHARSAAK